jgi:3-oxoacyl-(acyl-carrier-protein) synthase
MTITSLDSLTVDHIDYQTLKYGFQAAGGRGFCPNRARKAQLEYAMSNSFGFGGANGTLLFRRWSE